ncbi:uncharacterized protein LOC118426952 [Branchiostoma floridae]|uniref:Uncharacterized protein LOC118426952 n=1 Tax=Branchiostoma floridae TaxID=7739 RepID=A0A9J7N453_BRAFL|nr:uncharacterized protein LOC118426952 [Branchiostoma floridae]
MDKNDVDGSVPSVNIQQLQPTGATPLKQSAPYRSPPAIPPTPPMSEPIPAPTCSIGEAREKQLRRYAHILPKPTMPGAQYLPKVYVVPDTSVRGPESWKHTSPAQVQPNPQDVPDAPTTGRNVCNDDRTGVSTKKSARSGEALRQRSGPYTKKVHYPSRSQQRSPAKQHSWTVLTASSASTSTRQPEESSSTRGQGLGWLSGGLAQVLLQRGNAWSEPSSTERLKDFVPYNWLLQRLKKAAATGAIASGPHSSCTGKSATCLPTDEQPNRHTSSSIEKCAYNQFEGKATSVTSTDSDNRLLETDSSQTHDEPMELCDETSSEMETAYGVCNRPDGLYMETTAFGPLLSGHKSRSLPEGASDNRLSCPAVEVMEMGSPVMVEQGCEGTTEMVSYEEGNRTEGCVKRERRRRRFLSGPARLLVDNGTS